MLDPLRALARVTATSGTATFLDIYGEHGPHNDPYTPNQGERGFMYLDDGRTAEKAGHVLVHSDNTPVGIDIARGVVTGAALTVDTDLPPGAADLPVELRIGGGPADVAYTVAVTSAIDAGGPVQTDIDIPMGYSAHKTAAKISVQTAAFAAAGLTPARNGAAVVFTPATPGTEITTFSASVAPTPPS